MKRIKSVLQLIANAIEANSRLQEFELRRGSYRTTDEMAEIQAILDGDIDRH